MARKPTYEELVERIKQIDQEAFAKHLSQNREKEFRLLS